MRNRTLLLQEKKGSDSAEQIRSLLGNGLTQHYECDLDVLTEGFTMVTDNASVMARVAHSSVSTRIAPVDEKWMGCLVHQLNTAIKSCISKLANQSDMKEIFDNINAVKKIVRIFKQSNWNSLLPDGKKLIQEVETRFGTTFMVAHRFLQASSLVEEIINGKNSDPALDAFASLSTSVLPSGDRCFPALEAVGDALQDVVDLQRDWEASQTPTMHLALAKFQICLDKLQATVDGGSVWRGKSNGFIPAPRLSRLLCKAMLGWLEAKVRIHPFLMAGTSLDPLFREFQFISDLNKRRTYRSNGETIVRHLMSKIGGDDGSSLIRRNSTGLHTESHSVEDYSEPTIVGRKRTFSLLEYADCHFRSTGTVDEVSRYNGLNISDLAIDRSNYMKDPFCAIRFWHMHRSTFPLLFKVALRLYAIPVSSCASERVFRLLTVW